MLLLKWAVLMVTLLRSPWCWAIDFRMQFSDLTEFPEGMMSELPPTVDVLQIAHNKLKRITKKDFPPGCCQEVFLINLYDNFIDYIEDGVFEHFPKLVRIDLSDNLLKKVPNLKAKNLQRIDLQMNVIEEVDKEAMEHYKVIWHVDLSWNKIKHVKSGTFEENNELVYLNLANNPLQSIDEDGLPAGVENLYLDHTEITRLPSKHGIEYLKRLSIMDVPHLFSIPDPSSFRHLNTIDVTYSMHCCAFLDYQANLHLDSDNYTVCNSSVADIKEVPDFPETFYGGNQTASNESTSLMLDPDFKRMLEKYLEELFGSPTNETEPLCDVRGEIFQEPLVCRPKPDAFNPCQDVMGTKTLRVFSWFISIFAVLGNLFQLIILFYSRQDLTVYKLLMYNLGFANLMMGMYLLVLCCVDAYTYGKYYNYVQMWQYSGGCQAFGFIALFATQLSLCTLVLITIERFLLIIFALQVGNQMKLSHAKIAVAGAWLYSFIVAILPVTGQVSSYSKIAICLPVDIPTKVATGYIVWLLVAYIVTFFVIVACYLKMYVSISRSGRPGSHTRHTIDVQVAQRMAMIIFSNFLCWLPISIAGFIALYGGLSLNVDVAKFLIVFIFPLNACTNPFLYAIFTKVFRGDTLALLSSCGLCKNAEEKHRNRAPSNYFKSANRGGKAGGESSTKHFMHYEPPSQASERFERNIEAQTEFDSPETPIKVMIDPNKPYRQNIYESIREQEGKIRSDSTRGLLEDKDSRFRSESSDTCSTGMSVQSTDSEVYDEFSRMIGSVKTENYLA